MLLFNKKTPYLFILLLTHNTIIQSTIPEGMLDRYKLFDDIMGISEDHFKELVGASTGQKPDIARAKKIITYQQSIYPRAQTITQGTWAQPTLEQLRICVHARLDHKISEPTQFGSLHIVVHDPQNPKKTHARALHEQFPNGYFQVASHFNALEDRMGNYAYNLSNMNDAPAHGEESVLATMPAAIYRRYIMEPINLLSSVEHIFNLGFDNDNTPLIKGLKKQGPITNIDMRHFSVGVHHNIAVTSGYNDDGKMITRENDPFARPKPAYNKWMPDAGNDAIVVNQIFTAAHDINPKNRHDIEITPEQSAIARAVIYATYQATILAAVDNGAKTLVLMMLRPEVFNNDPSWVAQAVSSMSDIIIASGLEVHMVIRHRRADVQETFINEMRDIIATIESDKKIYAHDTTQLKKNIDLFFDREVVWIPLPRSP